MTGPAGDVVVVGGGVAGLACAVALSDRGLRVTVLERDAIVGGRARSWVDSASGDTVDIGPHVATANTAISARCSGAWVRAGTSRGTRTS